MVGSFRETVRVWVGQTVVSDLWLRPAKNLTTAQALFPGEAADEVEKLPFVVDVDRIRSRELLFEDSLVTLVAGEFEVADRGTMPMLNPRKASDALRRTDGAIVSEAFADKFHRKVGDVLDLGRLRAPIVGIYRDYSSDRGVIVIDRSRYIPAFGDSSVNTIVVFLRDGTDLEVARRELQRRFGPKYGAFVVTNGEVRREIMRIFDQTFMITYALLGVAIVVAVLGIVNTLAALILERTRELALLRVGGLSSRELTTMLVLESSLLGVASTVVGLVMGYALSWILIYVINKQSFGWTIDFHTPAALIAASLATTFLASAMAGLAPARLARRIDIASALKGG
jgi:putative ABC transport system permease protein